MSSLSIKIFEGNVPKPSADNPKVVFATEILGGKFWVKRFYFKKEFEASLYLQVFLANNGFRVPNLVISFKKQKILVESFVRGQTVLDCLNSNTARIPEFLRSGVEILSKFHKLNPDKKVLFIKNWGVADFTNKARELIELVNLLKIKINQSIFLKGAQSIAKIIKTCSETFFIHRDFNCRNVLVTKAGLVVIDFDRAGFGSFLWDLVSWLEHPILKIPGALKKKLLIFYKKVSGLDFTTEQYQAYTVFRALHALVFRLSRLVRGITNDYFSVSLIQTLNKLLEVSILEPKLEEPLLQLRNELLRHQSIIKAKRSL
jgi:thiamine kinase-like enzyme